jgi:HNH endonuclease
MTSMRPRNMYTEDKLRPAVAAATTLGEVLANLGLEDNPKRRRYVSTQIKAQGVDTSHFTHSGMLYTDEMLTAAVAESTTMVEVATRIGATPVGGTIAHLKRRITSLGLDTGHFRQPKRNAPPRPRPTSHGFRREGRRLVVDGELLRAAVPGCRSIAEVIRALGLEPSGPRHRVVRDEIQRLGLDSSHFLGQVEYLRGRPNSRVLPPEKVLVFQPEQHYRRDATIIRRALITCGVPERCAGCGTGPQWLGEPLTLEVDHVNGDFRDNRLENLRLLCPNCHATTNNYCRKKRATEAG